MNQISLELSNQINIKHSEIHHKQIEIDMLKQEITQLKRMVRIQERPGDKPRSQNENLPK